MLPIWFRRERSRMAKDVGLTRVVCAVAVVVGMMPAVASASGLVADAAREDVGRAR